MNTRTLPGMQGLSARRRARVRSLNAGATLGGLCCAMTVGAQQATPAEPAASAPKQSESSSLETVVVTARKTREKLTDVPLSVTAITSQTIQDAGLRSLQDIANLTSGLTITAAGAEAYLAPTIRGLTNLNGGSGDPNVAVFLDGIYLANNSAISLGLIAIERVEIVKGPVSALYGRNAFAGAINYISKKPPNKLGGDVEVTVGSDGMRTAKASLGVPVLPGLLSTQLSLGIDKSDGTWKDGVSGARAGGYDKRNGMLSFALTPTSKLVLDGSVYYGDDSFDIVPFGVATNNCGTQTSATAPVNRSAFRQFCGNFEYGPVEVPTFKPTTGATGNTREVLSDRLRLAYDFDVLDASLLFGHNDVKQTRYNDFTGVRDGIPFALAAAGTPATPNGNILVTTNLFGNVLNNVDRQLELRLQSKQTQRLRWSGGYNYFKSDFEAQTIVGVDTSGLPAGQVLANVAGLPIQALWGTVDGSVAPGRGVTTGGSKVLSPFGSIDYDLTPQLTASAELRHTKEEKTQTIFSTTSNLAPVNTAGNGTNTSNKTYSFNNYRAALRYKFGEDRMIYTSIANGTKSGGFNGRATIAEDVSFNPETNRTIEVGTKVALLDRKLQVGFAVFHVDTSDIQISGPAAAPDNPGLVTKNFGGTRSDGFELDLAAVPLTGLRLNAGIGYANSRFKSDALDFGVGAADCNLIPGCAGRLVAVTTPQGTTRTALALQDLRVPRTSKWTGTLGAQYNGEINGEWGWFTRGDFRYESSRAIQNANWAKIPARKLVNLRAGIESDIYRLAFFVNNVTDDATPEGVAQNTRLNDFTGPYAGALPARRTFGLTGSVSF